MARPISTTSLALAASLALATLASAQMEVRAGTYSAHVEVRSGSCCSASCGGVSTRADVTLALEAGGAATLRWSRTGCLVTVLPDASGHAMMPRDPGPPESFCASPQSGAEVRSMDGTATWRGTWHTDGSSAVVELESSSVTLSCAPETIDAHAVVACTLDTRGVDGTGLTLSGRIYLDRRPGLREHLDPYDDQLVLERGAVDPGASRP